ncbi:hypothetical protein TTHERM_00609380 (macronuclear) [Tetrahymena thermophila SB210]|uniref:Uncharacterized protein n=1 Tax=Tetrahymena thermophila (strain SB210) TaxID=312017 RepID=Q22YF1_TETTS|nr:hypothetical protein TTHERM_00609380 [Tetrahymena thermophila SB210]EAR90334.2 hypothetical protein TTHERM_00609380 [Tetrahymena thermophila SB210]|eukprot:XP_001010579.2 hypothetical protein TTHERM_00609380 [Tetrahymena thermophila SB210]
MKRNQKNQFQQYIQMKQDNNEELIVLNNILFLVNLSKTSQSSSRNLLNKWFQDSIKSYVLESVAAPLIVKHLCFSSTAQLKTFIHSQKTIQCKPKYMRIIEQYFFYIKKYNQEDLFIQNLQQILSNPEDITQSSTKKTYNTLKTVRKQFVCLLILKYFKIYGQLEVPSFYELWNICYPQEIQIKKKLTKFDRQIKSDIKIKEEVNCNDSLISSTDHFLNCSSSLSLSNQQDYLNQEISTYINSRKNSDKQLFENTNNDAQSSDYSDYNSCKQPINNRIFEEDSYEEESMNHFLQFNKQFQQQNEEQSTYSKDQFDNDQVLQRGQYQLQNFQQNTQFN